MNRRETFDDALDAAIDEIRGGTPLSDVLAAHGRHASELQPLLETSQSLRTFDGGVHRLPEGLADNFSIVRAALERERMVQSAAPASAPPRPPWWQRRWAVASLSLPGVTVAALAFAGAGGAAAATVAVANSDLGAKVVAAVTPDWAQNVVPSVLQIGGNDDGDTGTDAANVNTPVSSFDDGGQGALPAITVAGVIGNPQGNTFTLTAPGAEWKVQVDAGTEITGGIVEGANATVTGAQTGEQVLHGTQITTDAAAEPPPDRGPDNNADGTQAPNGPQDNNGNTPGDNGKPPNEPGAGNNGSPVGENSSENRSDTATPPTSVANGPGNGEPGANGPPGGPPAPNENASQNSAGANGNGSGNGNGNGGGSKDP